VVTFKFIHCSDLHLGSRAYGILSRDPELGKRMTEATFNSFSRIMDRAIRDKVDFMVISGDIFDETTETPATRYRFSMELSRTDIPIFICLGNHDYVMSWTDSIPYPRNVRVFDKEPESIVLNLSNGPVEIIGRSFPSAHSSLNPIKDIKGKDGIFSVALVHCSVDVVTMDDEYGPCRLSDMLNRSVEYWALGHIHKRSELNREPYVVYPGNIQGRSRREIGPKGAYMVSVVNDQVQGLEFFPTQEVLWEDVDCDISDKTMDSMMKDIVSSVKKGSIVNLMISGRGPLDNVLRLDTNAVMKQIEQASGCYVADIRINTYPSIDRDELSMGNDIRSKIVKSSDRISLLNRDEIIDMICSTKQSASIRYMLEWLDDDELKALVHDSETLLIDKLTGVSR
jgi:DNA repair protein SbcD/Mre11